MPDFELIEQSHPNYGPPAPVPIIQEEVEFAQLLELYRRFSPKRVLELGTYAGGTLFHWLQNATPGTLVVSVDAYEDKDNSHLYRSWCPDGVDFQVVRGDTRDPETIEKASQFAPYDFAFIDAGHLDEEVRADWANYAPMMGADSAVAFHDIVEYEGLPRIQVFRLWAELKKSHAYIEITEPGCSGIGVVFL